MLFRSFVKFQPNLKQYRKKSKTLREYRSVLKSRQKKTLNKENIEKEITRLKESLQEKESMFFSENDFSAFSINIVPKLAQAYENKIKSVVYDKKKAKKKELLSTYSIKVDFEGDFQGVLSFFDDLEYFSKVVKIQSFSMKRKSINPVVLSVKANLLAYGGGEP